MAQRRMFSLKVVDTDDFLDMPQSAQNLYFHLGMRADDDGFVANSKKIMKIVGSSVDDIKILAAKHYIIPFESGIIVICHFKESNYIQSDRYRPTIYKNEKNNLIFDDNGVYTLDTECIQGVSEMDSQVRLGKVRLGKVINMSDSENDEPDIFPKTPDEDEEPFKSEDKGKTELIKTVIDYLNEKAGTKYRHDSYKTLHHLSARIEDGYTLDDFKAVIDKKCADWIGSKWEDYLRPETLFNEIKFESYLNQRIRGSPKTSTPRKSIEDREREVREKYGNATR